MTEADQQTVLVERNVPCPMRDGTVLRADVYRPAQGRHPVLVSRTPYGKDHPMGVTNLMFPPVVAASRGFAVVVQDVRGRHASDGLWDPLRCEAPDGHDTVEWAAAQPWSTSEVGVFGSSYLGVTALQAVAARPEHLRCAVAYLTGGNYHDGWVYTGGALELLFNLRWTAGQALSELHRHGLSESDRTGAEQRLRWILDQPDQAVRFTPLSQIFEPWDVVAPYWREWLEHPEYDDYWSGIDLTRTLRETEIPVLNIAGWHDGFLGGQLGVWQALTGGRDDAGAGPGPDHELMIGPWDHEAYQGMRPDAAGERFFGPTAVGGALGLAGRILDWFEERLTGTGEGRRQTSPVRYFHMGPDEWRPAPVWPPGDDSVPLYLTSGGAANTRGGDGRLVRVPPPAQVVDSYVHDPADPVPTSGGRHLGYGYGRAGVMNQAAIEDRADVLCFTGELLSEPWDVLGSVRVELFVTSSADGADFCAKLVDVRPDGYCANVVEGIRRVSVTEGTLGSGPVAVVIDLWPTAYRFETGHRMRLEVASSNFPKYDRHGGLAGSPSGTRASDWVRAVQHVHSGPEHRSVLWLGGSGRGSA